MRGAACDEIDEVRIHADIDSTGGVWINESRTYTFTGRFTFATYELSLQVIPAVSNMELADQVGLEIFGVGEHHRPDFAVSAPAVVLAAGAMRTKRIRLTSAVSVLSADDPV